MPTNFRNLFMVVILSCIALSTRIAAATSLEDRRFDIELFLAESFHSDTIPEDLIDAVVAAEQAVGRPLAGHELFLFADRYFEAVYEPAAETPPRRHCFTCTMRVLTPRGYVMIGSLKVGDQVYSVDEASRTLVVNEIAGVIVGENQEFGRVISRAALLPIEATATHPFYLPDKGYYRSVGKIDEGSNLLGVRLGPKDSAPLACETLLAPLLVYQTAVGRGTVYNLTLTNDPHNYIVEGVLVHNIKGGI